MTIKTQATQPPLSLEEKVDMLFRYIFSFERADDEERFWNELTAAELEEIETIREEDTISFAQIKTFHLLTVHRI